jgi:hypothetical protein
MGPSRGEDLGLITPDLTALVTLTREGQGRERHARDRRGEEEHDA